MSLTDSVKPQTILVHVRKKKIPKIDKRPMALPFSSPCPIAKLKKPRMPTPTYTSMVPNPAPVVEEECNHKQYSLLKDGNWCCEECDEIQSRSSSLLIGYKLHCPPGNEAPRLICPKYVQKMTLKESKRLLQKERRLILALDLDQTLVDSFPVDPLYVPQLDKFLSSTDCCDICDACQTYRQHLTKTDDGGFAIPESGHVYYALMRPGVKDFLKLVDQIYEVYIYTNSKLDYACSVVSMLGDVGRKLVHKNRVISQRIRDRLNGVEIGGTLATNQHPHKLGSKRPERVNPFVPHLTVALDDRTNTWGDSATKCLVNIPMFSIISASNTTTANVKIGDNDTLDATSCDTKEEIDINKDADQKNDGEALGKNDCAVAKEFPMIHTVAQMTTSLLLNDRELQTAGIQLYYIHNRYFDQIESDKQSSTTSESINEFPSPQLLADILASIKEKTD